MDDYETISSAQASPDSGQMPKSTDENVDVSMLKMLAGIRK
jgi:hypothetical protein